MKTVKDAINWTGREEPPEIYISGHPKRTRKALVLLVAEVQRLQSKNERMKSAISWALGEGDSDFGENKPENAPTFWWRYELRKRAESA